MKSQPQNNEFRNNPENFYPCTMLNRIRLLSLQNLALTNMVNLFLRFLNRIMV